MVPLLLHLVTVAINEKTLSSEFRIRSVCFCFFAVRRENRGSRQEGDMELDFYGELSSVYIISPITYQQDFHLLPI